MEKNISLALCLSFSISLSLSLYIYIYIHTHIHTCIYRQWFVIHIYMKVKVKVFVIQSCPTLCDPTDCSLPDSSVHGFLQARILEWVAIPFSRGSSWPRNQTQVSWIAGRFFTIWATRKPCFCIFEKLLFPCFLFLFIDLWFFTLYLWESNF